MKKMISVILSMAVLASLFSACKKTVAQDVPITTTADSPTIENTTSSPETTKIPLSGVTALDVYCRTEVAYISNGLDPDLSEQTINKDGYDVFTYFGDSITVYCTRKNGYVDQIISICADKAMLEYAYNQGSDGFSALLMTMIFPFSGADTNMQSELFLLLISAEKQTINDRSWYTCQIDDWQYSLIIPLSDEFLAIAAVYIGSQNSEDSLATSTPVDGAIPGGDFISGEDNGFPGSSIPGSTTNSAGGDSRIYCYQCGADCTAQGLEADGRCADCNYQDMIADREEPPAQNTPICNHDYLEATCTEPKTCWLCGETTGSPRGHDYRPATCTDPKTCKLCGERTGYALGHDYTAPTCTVPGSCKICGAPGATATGHNWVRVTETVYHEERGHYEDVEVAVKVNEYQCFACSYASQSLSAYYSHFDSTHSADLYADVIRDRYNTIERWTYQTETQWVVDTPAYSETVTAGYRCSVCGEIK